VSSPGQLSRSSAVYAQLRRKLLLGEFPLIERLGEVRLAEQFGASRTPVREALVRLESEGLVQRRPEGGFYPRSPNIAGILDLYELRRIIELAALARPRERGTTHDTAALDALTAEWERMQRRPPKPDPDFVLIDERFHVSLAAAAGNAAFAEQLQGINERIRILRMQNFIHAKRIEVTAEQHLAILAAVREEDPDTAVVLMAAHLDEALQQASGRAAAAVERMVTAGAVLGGGRDEGRG
jgi:DNA-binding GntR family transcriptional regulator